MNRPPDIAGALHWGAGTIQSESPRVDAERLLAFVTGRNPTWFRTWPDHRLDESQWVSFQSMCRRRGEGEPVAHLVGEQGFWTLDLMVTPDTLIPRPDTETLIEAVLTLSSPRAASVLDLGTGTGAIALALKSENPDWHVTACDAHAGAVDLARANAAHVGLSLEVIRSHWFESVPRQCFDLIVSNPPYIEDNDPHLAQGDVRYEPHSALTAGPDGLDDLRQIVAETPGWLAPGGWLVVEHGHNQGEAVRALFHGAGLTAVETRRDYGGNERITLGGMPAAAGGENAHG